jgi:predicted ferric reductase
LKLTLANFGYKLIAFFVLVLLVFWIFASPLAPRFSNLYHTLTSFGQVSGLLGLLLLCFVIILNSRLPILERFFGGMNRVYIAHHNLGGIAFILIMLHPVFLTGKYLTISTQTAAMFLVPGKEIFLTLGIIAFLLLSFLLVLTFYLKPAYLNWLRLHSLLSIVFAVSIIHSYFIYSDLLNTLSLKLYVCFFVLASLAAAGYQVLMKYNLINKIIYEVVSVNRLSEQVYEVVLQPSGRGITYLAGQFIFVNFVSKNIPRETHPFSITSCPDEKTLSIVVKNLGDFTAQIHLLHKGDRAFVEGPFGYFSVEKYPNQCQLWIAGGIGITPFISMAKNLKSDGMDVYLYYSALDKQGLIGADELRQIAARNNRFHLVPFLYNERGLLTGEVLMREVPRLSDREVFICGPAKMMSSLRKQLVALKIDTNAIHTEEFSL